MTLSKNSRALLCWVSFMLSLMLSVIMLNIIMLSVMAPNVINPLWRNLRQLRHISQWFTPIATQICQKRLITLTTGVEVKKTFFDVIYGPSDVFPIIMTVVKPIVEWLHQKSFITLAPCDEIRLDSNLELRISNCESLTTVLSPATSYNFIWSHW
jgi:hypothetical protein